MRVKTRKISEFRFIAPKILFTTLGSCKYDYRDSLARLEQQIPSLEKVFLLDDISGIYINPQPNKFFDTFINLISFGSLQHINWHQLENEIADKDVLNLQFTSGSTGAPKAAALTHHGLINCAQYIGMNMNVTPEDKVIVPVPLFHAFGLIIGTEYPPCYSVA
jgi:acyl-CoA synthetase (AMP-forming)/AMP-acid ligase II